MKKIIKENYLSGCQGGGNTAEKNYKKFVRGILVEKITTSNFLSVVLSARISSGRIGVEYAS